MPYPLAGTGLRTKSRGTSQHCSPLAGPPTLVAPPDCWPQGWELVPGRAGCCWEMDVESASSQLQFLWGGRGSSPGREPSAGQQVGDGSCSTGCKASSFQGKGPPEWGQGGAPGSWKPNTGNHIRDTLWEGHLLRTKDPSRLAKLGSFMRGKRGTHKQCEHMGTGYTRCG